MPSTRKSTGGRQATGPGKQSTLSFSHRVTKTVPKSAKDSVIPPSIAKPAQPEKAKPTEPEDEADDVQVEPTPEPEPELELELEPELDEDQESEIVPEKSEAELAAEKVSNAAIERYWRKLESQRMAKQVHQEGLSTGERVLRYFDVSSQYGPCMGISRVRRWQRAQKLGLSPPIEVLAVLLKEEAKGNSGIEKAHMDEIMNPTAAAA
ncbi:putative dna polymerase [Phialemonium atrogriseum]|uniref:Dna polymerase n=1 Tax=Phialemonium atrogriseum TaxID=1093897 RepID=A0AAJ0CBL0_9PEZI|nr:putative dna polymerase [Phialemonium atrogriseum]KAK1772282.1 putative dna polymerase [Phialemonium atrogriseum]